jgi:hypothetical protein
MIRGAASCLQTGQTLHLHKADVKSWYLPVNMLTYLFQHAQTPVSSTSIISCVFNLIYHLCCQPHLSPVLSTSSITSMPPSNTSSCYQEAGSLVHVPVGEQDDRSQTCTARLRPRTSVSQQNETQLPPRKSVEASNNQTPSGLNEAKKRKKSECLDVVDKSLQARTHPVGGSDKYPSKSSLRPGRPRMGRSLRDRVPHHYKGFNWNLGKREGTWRHPRFPRGGLRRQLP